MHEMPTLANAAYIDNSNAVLILLYTKIFI